MQVRSFIALVLFLLAASCTSSHKAAKDKNAVTVDLDSIEVTASRDNPYRGAATKDFDLTHTRLEVRFDYAKQYLYGKATLTLKPHFYPQQQLILDAKQFDIREVSLMTGENTREGLKFTYDSLLLKIQLDKEYTRDDLLKIYIDYTAKPEERKIGGSAAIEEDKGLYFINPLGKDTTKPIQIWTQGETEANSCWFPTIDKPNQKMTDEIYITHLKKYVSLSNGLLVSTQSLNDSMVTDYWKMDLPHSPYLVMMAVGDFAIVNDRWRDVPVSYYVEKDYAPYAKQIFGNTPQMMEFFSQKLGFDYPWQKYSQIVVRDYVSGAMENTSATLHSEILQRNSRELIDETYEDVISHELFHQWFGDLVTVESWSNIPLNESFATYGEYLWNEYKYGREYADFKFYDNYEKYLEEAKDKNVDLIRYYYNTAEDMFDRHSYEKGGLLLHYLRNVVGDEAFFKSLEIYLKANQFKSVEVNHLRLAFEEVTGKDLNWFFNEWFLNSGHPSLDINYSYDADSVHVAITQKHNTPKELIYQLPMRIDVWYGHVVNSYKVNLQKKSQTFSFKAYGKPDLIDADAERVLLGEKKENKTTDNYIFQYLNAPLYVQRYEAIEKLVAAQKESSKAKDALIKAFDDKAYHIRDYAIDKLDLEKTDTAAIYTMLVKRAKEDPSSWVRKSAIEKLGESPSASAYVSLFEAGINDSSYEVAGASLKALNKTNPKKAIQVAKGLESEKNNNILSAVADIYSKEGDSLYQSYFATKLRKTNGISKYTLFYYYANYLIRMDKDVVLPGIKVIEEEGMASDQHFLTGAAKGSLKRIAKSFEDKKKKAGAGEQDVKDYDLIVANANAALDRLSKKNAVKKN
jgi:aminopeptidase N